MICSCFFTSLTGSVTSTATLWFTTRIMRFAKRKVEMVSSKCADSPQMHAMSRVLQFPPRASLSTLVSLVWRYGMCAADPSALFRLNATTHCSRYVKDWLMCIDSFFSVSSMACPPPSIVFFSRSDPARSTMLSLEEMTLSLTPDRDLCAKYTVKMEWLRLDLRLSLCCAQVRPSSPENKRFSASCSLDTFTSVSPRTCTPFPPFSSTMVNSWALDSLGALPSTDSKRSNTRSL
mmetsp:Transcript_40884/g.75696  ORF Transcript_40884/g.75696 Transcript_40884/m.75696 type:complete len:234 (-) Transcript_40884:498-1199(-)